ncbi:transposase [Vibrio jasicida]|uniref:transposase n=2 Tax=Vibrio jasicida TaxID=766224 RepID=UPI001C0FF373|nr:transposase [Vibrio jasicida]
MAKHRNPAYTEEFRKEAVRLASLPGRTAVSVAKELGISSQQIRNWKRQFTRLSDKQFNTLDGVDYSKKESEELRALRAENKRLKDKMEFLKSLGVLREAARVKFEFTESYACCVNYVADIMSKKVSGHVMAKGLNIARMWLL